MDDNTAKLIKALEESLTATREELQELKERFDVHCTMEFKELSDSVADLLMRVHGRNKSAPVKRNMTDADAVRTLTGDVRDLGHKEVAEVIGLTYAQVYSCRMEYTFKHVHSVLRKSGWVNPWAKS